jgi:hypothetical protein
MTTRSAIHRALRLAPAMAILLALASPASAQQERVESAAVRTVVDRLFDGMRERDAAKMSATFHPVARLYGVGPDGEVRETAAADFVAGVMRAPAGLLLDEVLGEVEIRIDGPLASVWTYYDFFAGDDFSHCGYNTFTMLHSGGEWRIVALADSRRREDCRQQRRPGGA